MTCAAITSLHYKCDHADFETVPNYTLKLVYSTQQWLLVHMSEALKTEIKKLGLGMQGK